MTLRKLALPILGLAVTGLLIAQARGKAAPTSDPERALSVPPPSGRIVAEGRVATYPGAEVVVGTDVAGTIVRLPLEERQQVGRGELVAELLADDLRAEIGAAKARIDETSAEIRLAEVEVERAERLLEEAVDTQARLDRARRDLEVAGARRETAKAEVVRLEAKLAKTRIAAPIAGTVTVRHADPGETVDQGAALVTIADLTRLRIEAEVDEFDVGKVELGAGVRITAEGREGSSWKGTVEEIPDTVSGRRLKPQDPAKPADTRVLIVKIRLDEPTPLKLGQRVEIAIGG